MAAACHEWIKKATASPTYLSSNNVSLHILIRQIVAGSPISIIESEIDSFISLKLFSSP